MKFLLQAQRIYESEGTDVENLGIFNTPEDAMRSFPRAKEWFEYEQPYTTYRAYTSLLLARGTLKIYAFIEPVEESPEFADTEMFKFHFDS